MNIIKSTLLLLFFVNNIYGQYQWGAQAYTQPIGVTNLSIAPAEEGSPTFSFISSVYDQDYAYSGLVYSVNGSTLTLGDLDGELEQTPYAENELTQEPYFLRLRDGGESHNGRVFLVLSNSENDITVNVAELSNYISPNDSVDIIKANTLESLFGVGEDFHGASGRPSHADQVLIWSSVGWKTYFYHEDKWQTFGTRSSQNKTVIYPDEGVVYKRVGAEDLVFSFSGYSPQIAQCYRPMADRKFLASNPFSVDMKISELIDHSSNWTSSSNPNSADQVLRWSGMAWVSYYHDVNVWRNVLTQEIDDHVFSAGDSFFIIRTDIAASESYVKILLPEG